MSIKLITAPSVPAVTVADCKAHCRVTSSAEDAWFEAAAYSATAACEHLTGRRFITQTWEAVYDAFPAYAVELGLAPVASVVSLKYVDSASTEQTISAANYVLDSDQSMGIGYVLPAAGYAWPTPADAANVVRVRYTVGYGATAATTPASAKQWMLMHVGTAYRMRESVAVGVSINEVPNRYVDALLDGLMVWRL